MRTAKQADFLARHHGAITAFKLKGMLYFGTAHELYEITKQYLDTSGSRQTQYIILDFENVAAIDSTALMSLLRTHEHLTKQNVRLIMSAISSYQFNQIKNIFIPAMILYISLYLTDTLDHAIEYCEDRLLEYANLIDTQQPSCIERVFEKLGWNAVQTSQLKNYLQKKQLHDHQILIRSGEDNDDLYIITSGKLEIVSKNPNNKPVRLRVLTSGMIVGEMSLYTGLPRSADVIASGDTVVYRLSSSRLNSTTATAPRYSH